MRLRPPRHPRPLSRVRYNPHSVRHLGRILLNVLTVLSLLLCVATAVLWVRSYWWMDVAAINSRRLHRALSGGGGIFLERFDFVRRKGSWRNPSATPTQTTTADYATWRAAWDPSVRRWEWETRPYELRAELVKRAWGPDLNLALPQVEPIDQKRREMFSNVDGTVVADALVGHRVWIPYWLLFAATAALPSARIAARLRRSRRSHLNLCPTCGYDRRATPDRCPECGTIPAR